MASKKPHDSSSPDDQWTPDDSSEEPEIEEIREDEGGTRGGVEKGEDDDEIEWEEEEASPEVVETPVDWGKVPMPVRKSAEAFFQRTNGFTCYQLRRGDDHLAFTVELAEGVLQEEGVPMVALTLTETGALIEVARGTHPLDLPKAVRQSLERHYRGVDFHACEEISTTYYELEYTMAGEVRVVQLDASGLIISDEEA
jgi:hypothetical protein